MGDRMSLNKDLEEIFKAYTNQVNSEKAKKISKYGSRYNNLSYNTSPGDSHILNPHSSENIQQKEIFQKCVQNFVDSNQDRFSTHILYLDCNNLYGSAQTLQMPLNNYTWCDKYMCSEIERFFKNRSEDFKTGRSTESWDSFFGVINSDTGYFIQCDLSFSDKCKSKLQNFPPAPHHSKLVYDDLSNFAKNSIGGRNLYTEGSKLIASFEPKYEYVIHSSLADLYSSMGVTFENVSKVLSFHQERFLKSWVELNTKGRKQAALNNDSTLKDFFKLMVNACYGEF